MDKKWVSVFKALSNINRLKIIEMLFSGANLSVTQISDKLGISLKSTSKHLIILQNLNLLESEGKSGHVFYKFSKIIPADFKNIIKLLF
jgi:DNA-binding transcriptional ArsR family regulator